MTHRCIVALDLYKTEYNNSANQVHLWFEKQCDSDIDRFREEH